MLNHIIYELISVAGTILSLLFVRWMMELSTPEEDLLLLQMFTYRLVRTWQSGSFDNMIATYRARKLLDW